MGKSGLLLFSDLQAFFILLILQIKKARINGPFLWFHGTLLNVLLQ